MPDYLLKPIDADELLAALKKALPPSAPAPEGIADCLGYSSADYFSKAFRRFYGISPRDCKNRKAP